ncbi:MAG: site-specific DNA-methyltransferase [Bacteroidales bacterium]|nr:site-specific DNA-methyltransferase [Bacteroidales bacterium]
MPTLNFKGKSFVQNHHLAVKYHQLVPKKDKSLTDKVSLHDNLIVQGDNLNALKALLPTYAGKVKCIYIDPPYNTGNEGWVYNDKVNSPMMREWLGKVIDKDDLTRHDKWLCMMMPRLKLLRELLAEDGVIFISIDYREAHNLKILLDEVFNENNLIAEFIWHKKYGGGGDNKNIVTEHETVFSYSKSKNPELEQVINAIEYDFNDFAGYEIDEDGKYYSANESILMRGPNSTPDKRPNLCYPIITPDGNEIIPRYGKGTWAYGKETLNTKIKNNELIWKKVKDEWMLYKKQFLYNDTDEVRAKKPRSILDKRYSIGQTGEGTNILKEIFNGERLFQNPKPISLIKFLLNLATNTNENSIILDSFAGSGTTAHAVLDLNKEDGGNRKFILVEMEDYANTITAERVRRVINGVPTSKNFKEGTGGTFSYFELGEPIEMESILRGENLPSFEEFAKYLFYTATGEEFDPSQINKATNYIGTSKNYEVYLFYKADIEYLKSTALTLDRAKSLGKHNKKKRLVFAPAKFVDNHTLTDLRIEFSQLPFEIYKLKS